MLDRLNKVNDIKILSVFDDKFKTYGKIVVGYDFSKMIDFMKNNTEIPQQGNIYKASVYELENAEVMNDVRNIIYGGMPVEAGYCNGRNSTYNGFEYHKGSEINIAVTDFMLVLGHTYDIIDNSYSVDDAQVFFVPQSTAIEMYQTTLHLSPCKTSDAGFRDIVILPYGTNTPLEKPKDAKNDEDCLLLMKNKWVIAHPDREPLIKQGAFPGVKGENKELFY